MLVEQKDRQKLPHTSVGTWDVLKITIIKMGSSLDTTLQVFS